MAGYAKLWSGITDSSLWSASKDAKILFITLLAKADSTGFVEAAPSGLARAANLTLAETHAAINELSSPDPESKSKIADGRRIAIVPRGYCLVNYEEHRDRKSEEERREYMRGYMREYREAKSNGLPGSKKDELLDEPVNSVNCGKSELALLGQAEATSEEEEKDKEAPPAVGGFDLDRIFRAYPVRKNKAEAIKALREVVKSKATYDRILAAVERFAAEEAAYVRSGSKEFRAAPPYMQKWIKRRRWEDYSDEDGLFAKVVTKSPAQLLAEESKRQRLAEYEGPQ